MALRARKPEAVTKRLKLFMFGPAGIGKSTALSQFPNAYIIDTEKGTENYADLINKSSSVVYQTNDIHEVIAEVKALLTERHDYRTLCIDPITTVYNDLLDKCEQKVGSDFGRHYQAANKEMKRLMNLLVSLDMNVIVTAHAKVEYGDNLKKLGYTFDGWKQLDYLFDLVIELGRRGDQKKGPRIGRVVKTRIEAFPDQDVFDWTYENFAKRCDPAVLGREAQVVKLASAEQVRELNELLAIVRLPEGTTDKWLSKAGVESFEDMSADAIAKCVDYVKSRLPGIAAA